MLKKLRKKEKSSKNVDCKIVITEAVLKCTEKNKELTHFLQKMNLLDGNKEQRGHQEPSNIKYKNL